MVLYFVIKEMDQNEGTVLKSLPMLIFLAILSFYA